MAQESRLDAAALNAVLTAMLAKHPDARVVGIADNGLFVPLPSALPLSGQQVINGLSSALELVVAEDRITVIEAWERVRRIGVANALVHPLADPQQTVRLHFIDATERYGVYLGFLTGFQVAVDGRGFEEVPVAPRVSVIRKDQVAVITEVDAAASRILGWSAEEMLGRRALDFVHVEDHKRAIESWMEMLARPGSARRVRLRHRHRDGHWVWFEVTNHNLLVDPDHGCVVAEMVDISDEMAAQEALRANEQLLRRLTEALPLGVLQIDSNLRVIYQNERVAAILATITGTIVDDQHFAAVVPDDREVLQKAVHAALRYGRDSDLECGYQHPQGSLRRCAIGLRALSTPAGEVTGAIVCLTDVTEDVQLREELRYRATFDALTGCRNRASTLAALEQLLAVPAPGYAGTAVIFIDLNEFKQINDRLGHAAGDQLLVHVADRLRTATRDGDLLGRFGGDEFVVVSRNVATVAEARAVAERLVAALGRGHLEIDGQRVPAQASIGVAWSAPGQSLADALIARADAAMYQAKKHRTGPLALVVSDAT